MKKLTRFFLSNTSGNFAVIFAVALLPVALSVGLAVDYTYASRNKSGIQQALDVAALAAGANRTLSDEERIQIALDTFEANSLDLEIAGAPTFTIENQKVIATYTYDSSTYFGNLVGKQSIGISIANEVSFAVDSAAEVALVLDYSGSMASNNKWSTMRDAAKDLIDILGEYGEKTDVSFGLVPFSNLVYGSFPGNTIVGLNGNQSWTGCTQDRRWPFNTQDTSPVSNNNATKWGETPSASNGNCMSHINRNLKIRPLNTDHAQVKGYLDQMTPGGNTHISLGLEMGWHLISPNAPFTEGVAYDTEGTKKFIVVLTDGAQTTKGHGPNNSYSIGKAEQNLVDLCSNVKNKGVYVVTVAFDLGDGSTKDRLKNCATNNGYFFDANSNAELAEAFQTVAALIKGSLHVSK